MIDFCVSNVTGISKNTLFVYILKNNITHMKIGINLLVFVRKYIDSNAIYSR